MNQKEFFKEVFTEPMGGKYALDLFARDGKMATIDWGEFFSAIDACDIRQDYLEEYNKNWPQATTRQLDTVAALKSGEMAKILGGRKYDFIAIDNPLGRYGDDYYEHYDFLEFVPSLLAPDGYIYIPVNLYPYNPKNSANAKDDYGMDMDGFEKWMQRRREFYGKERLTISDAIKFYLDFFHKYGCDFNMAKWHLRKSQIPSHPDFLLYLLLKRQPTAN